MGLDIKTIATFENLFKQVGKIEKSVSKDTLANFKQTYVNDNPLKMDAKAYLAKIKIETGDITKTLSPNLGIQPKSEYQLFEEKVLKESGLALRGKISDPYSKINPITSENIGVIKTELSYLVENQKLKQKISDCTNPDELYILLKRNMGDRILVSDSYLKFMDKVNSSSITPELEKKYNILCSREFKRINRIVELFASKSTNPEVLRLEEEVRALGIKEVNFSNDLTQAKLIKETVEDLVQRRIPLPSSIKVTPMLPADKGGLAAHIQDGGYIFLPTSAEQIFSKKANSMIGTLARNTAEFKNASVEKQEKFIKELAMKNNSFLSTQNPKHSILHEAAHTFQPKSLAAELRLLTENEIKTAGEISIYAKSSPNGIEAMPEMFVKLMDGQKLTDKQMELYLKLGGIVPYV